MSPYFLLLFFIVPIATSYSPVLDINGNPLEIGSAYYFRNIVSQEQIGGGVLPASKPNRPKCPQYVGHLSDGFNGETPVMFYPSDPSQKFISVSWDLKIVFNTTSSGCPQGAWQLETDDTNPYRVFISTGGVVGNWTAVESLFKIENDVVPGLYKLTYCPSSSTDDIMCGRINTIDYTNDFEIGWLGLSPFYELNFNKLSFIKA